MNRLPVPTFSSFDFDVEERIPRWENHSSGTIAAIQGSTHDATGLALNLWNQTRDELHFISVSGRSRLIDRTPQHIKGEELGSTALALITKGEAFFNNSSGTHILRPGDLLMYNLDSPFILGSSQEMSELMVEIPTALSHTIFGLHQSNAEVIRTKKSDPGHPYKLALANTIRSVITEGEDFLLEHEQLVNLLQLVAGQAHSASSASHLAAAKTFIQQNFRSTSLSVETIAQHLNVSERHVSRVFAESGTTVANYLQEQRVEAAAQLLADGSTALSVGEIAAACGFATQQHFSRVFKQKFEQTPTQWRRAHHEQAW